MVGMLIRLVPQILGSIAGCLIGYWLNSLFLVAKTGTGFGVDAAIFLVVAAPIIVGLSIFVLFVTRKKFVGSFISFFSAFVELSIMIFGARVLIDWYSTPDNPHLEPLFVIVGVALVGIEYGRSWLRTFEKVVDPYFEKLESAKESD